MNGSVAVARASRVTIMEVGAERHR